MLNMLNSKSSFLSPFGLTLCILSILGAAYSKNETLLSKKCSKDSDCKGKESTCVFVLEYHMDHKVCADCNHPIARDDLKLEECQGYNTWMILVMAAVPVVVIIIGGAVAAICFLAPCCPVYQSRLRKKRNGQQDAQAEPDVAAGDGQSKADPSVTNSAAVKNDDVAANDVQP